MSVDHPSLHPTRGIGLGIQQLFEPLAQFEISDSLRRNLDCLAGLWIAAPAGPPLPMPKAAEAPELDLLSGIERLHDAVQDLVRPFVLATSATRSALVISPPL